MPRERRADGRRATWKNPALSFRVIGQVEPTLSGSSSLSRRRAMHASRCAVSSGGHEEAELPAYSSVPAGWLSSRLFPCTVTAFICMSAACTDGRRESSPVLAYRYLHSTVPFFLFYHLCSLCLFSVLVLFLLQLGIILFVVVIVVIVVVFFFVGFSVAQRSGFLFFFFFFSRVLFGGLSC